MPALPIVNEFSISSPVRFTWTTRVRGFSAPTLPAALVTNQMRPWKSGSAEVIRWLPVDVLGEVVVAEPLKGVAARRGLVDLQMVGLGRAPHAVVAVEEEVAAAREVLEFRGPGRRGRRGQDAFGQQVQRLGVDEAEPGRLDRGRADRDDAALGVEGQRPAQGGGEARVGQRGQRALRAARRGRRRRSSTCRCGCSSSTRGHERVLRRARRGDARRGRGGGGDEQGEQERDQDGAAHGAHHDGSAAGGRPHLLMSTSFDVPSSDRALDRGAAAPRPPRHRRRLGLGRRAARPARGRRGLAARAPARPPRAGRARRARLARPRLWTDTVGALAATALARGLGRRADAPVVLLAAAGAPSGLPVGPPPTGGGRRPPGRAARARRRPRLRQARPVHRHRRRPAARRVGRGVRLVPRRGPAAAPGDAPRPSSRRELGRPPRASCARSTPSRSRPPPSARSTAARLADGTAGRRQGPAPRPAAPASRRHRGARPRRRRRPPPARRPRVGQPPRLRRAVRRSWRCEELDFRLEALNMVELGAVLEDAGAGALRVPRPDPRPGHRARAGHGARARRALRRAARPLRRRAGRRARCSSSAIQGVLEATLVHGLLPRRPARGQRARRRRRRFSLVDFGICGRLDADGARRARALPARPSPPWTPRGQLEALRAFGAIAARRRPRRAGRRAAGRVIDALPAPRRRLTFDAAGRDARRRAAHPRRARLPGCPRSSCCSSRTCST